MRSGKQFSACVSAVTGGTIDAAYGINIQILEDSYENKENSDEGNDNQSHDGMDPTEWLMRTMYVNENAPYHRIFCLFRDCRYGKIVHYFDTHEIEEDAILNTIIYASGLLFTGAYDRASDLCEGFLSSTDMDEPITFDDAAPLNYLSNKVLSWTLIPIRTLKLIKACADHASFIRHLRDTICQRKENGDIAHVNYVFDDINDYFMDVCVERNSVISSDATLEELKNWCSSEGNIDERISYATAEFFFLQKQYIPAARCYLLAALSNWGDPKYYAYYGQCMLRGHCILDGGLMAGYEATKIAIMLEPNNAEWHIINTTLLSHIQLYTPFNVFKLYIQSLEFASDCPGIKEDTISTLNSMKDRFFNDLHQYD